MRTVCLFHRFPGILAVGSCLSCFSLSPDSLKEGGKSTQKTSLESCEGRWGPIIPPPPLSNDRCVQRISVRSVFFGDLMN